MARRDRAMSVVDPRNMHSKNGNDGADQAYASNDHSLPSPTLVHASLRGKKSSNLAFLKILRKLRSPGNSDDEEGDEDDLDFGCGGLRAYNDMQDEITTLHDTANGELHISLKPQHATGEHLHNGQNGTLDILPSRSASIADSMISSISSINLSSSDCTLSTPTSYSQPASARSSFSNPTSLPTSPTNKKCFIAGSSPRASTQAVTSLPYAQPPEAIQEEVEEETEEQGVLRRKQEEQAAIEALEAYFAYRSASDAVASSFTTTNILPSVKEDKETEKHDRLRLEQNDIYRRASSPSLLPYASPYFETYANEPLPALISPKQHSYTTSSTSSADRTLPSSPVDAISKAYPHPQQQVSSKQAILFPRPPLRTRRSEASLRDIYDSSRKVPENKIGQRRPSLAPNMTLSMNNNRPRGLTFSNTRSAISSSSISEEETSDFQVISQNQQQPLLPLTPTSPNTQIVSYVKRTTTTTSNFLNLGPSPESPNFKLGDVIPSPPRSSSLASGWPSSSASYDSSKSPSKTCVPYKKASKKLSLPLAKVKDSQSEDTFHGHLEEYRFPDPKFSSISSSILSTPAISPSPSLVSLSKIGLTNEIVATAAATTAPKMHSPLGSATASRRGSLVSSPPPALRSRAGSVVAGTAISVGGGSGNVNRNAIYEYI